MGRTADSPPVRCAPAPAPARSSRCSTRNWVRRRSPRVRMPSTSTSFSTPSPPPCADRAGPRNLDRPQGPVCCSSYQHWRINYDIQRSGTPPSTFSCVSSKILILIFSQTCHYKVDYIVSLVQLCSHSGNIKAKVELTKHESTKD